MKKISVRFLLLGLIWAAQAPAQINIRHTHLVGGDTSVWTFTSRTDHHKAVVRVSVGNASGTGTIVRVNQDKPKGNGFEGYCLTAYHVVRDRPPGDSQIKVHYRDGRISKGCQVVAFDAEYDAALLWVWVPANLNAATVAKQPVAGRDTIEICGLGGNSKLKCCLRSFKAIAALPTTEHQLYADVSLLPGDSGGPVFNTKGQVVGVISGGWFWWDARVRDKSGGHVMATWPARAANGTVLGKLIARVEGGIEPRDNVPVMEQVATK
jgi:hypothetical protein